MRLLLDSGVDLFMTDDFGATPIDVARDWQRLDILDMLAGKQEKAINYEVFSKDTSLELPKV